MNAANNNKWFRQVMENLQRDDGLTASAVINERDGPFPLWERLASPEGPCEMLMEDAVYIALGDYRHPLCGRFLDWTISTAERALSDPRFEIESESRFKGWRNSPISPGNRGRVLAISALASAMKNGVDVDQHKIREAADQLVTSALLEKGRNWADRLVQGQFMYAVRLLMICGDWERARKLISVKRKFEAVSRQHQIMGGLLGSGNCEGNNLPDLSSPAWDKFQEYFKSVRVPEGNPIIREDGGGAPCFYRMQIGLIYHRIMSRGQKIIWPEVFSVVGAGG